MRMVYKAFGAGYVCRGHAFRQDGEMDVTDRAKCANSGFHAAENPADCLKYYPDAKNSVYCICEASGDMDEDAVDSKIACTKLRIVRELQLTDFMLHCLIYLAKHPECRDKWRSETTVAKNGYALAVGRDPLARGAAGDVIAMLQEDAEGRPASLFVVTVGKNVPENVYIDASGEVRT